MKKIITVLLLVVATNASAQFEKGSYLLGGSFSFSWQKTAVSGQYYNNYPSSKQINASESPAFGIFVIDNLAVGAGLSFTQTRLYNVEYYNGNSTGFHGEKFISYTVTPFVRYYIQRAFIHVNYDVGYGYGAGVDNGLAVADTHSKVHGFKTGVGYAILLNPHVAIEPFFGYAYTRNDDNNDHAEYKINTLFLQVGIQVYLSKKN